MSAAPKLKLTMQEYFALEEKALYKSDFYKGEMFAMAGGSLPHNKISVNLMAAIHRQLSGSSCQPYGSDQRIFVEKTGLLCYPDLSIVCGEETLCEDAPHSITNPRVIAEVLSPSTEHYDRHVKFSHYQQIPSLQEYVLIAQEEARCERFTRQAEGTWLPSTFIGMEATLTFSSVPVQIPLATLYANVKFPS